ncbi:MAG: FHA domain-containing protein [Methanomicrobiaceae archaeon]|uniref:FHA domain-containing protein n=1 Tax=hydrocarbon metagenome TaxID=938273 RepID=A0A0W8FL27_9ZZZZ|nr:FHA domain-containing protein [Methanomicrobiaceae archaeon]MDD5418373.1 FHA domain-containing protein [Methanomicrobiaceae archaeon]
MIDEDASTTYVLDERSDSLRELSGYLDVLSSSTRLKILKVIETTPKDVRQISSEIQTSYENTKKHLDRLLGIGVVKKEAGLSRETSTGIHPVWKYSLIPGGMEAIIRNLGLFGNIRIPLSDTGLSAKLERVRREVSGEFLKQPAIILLGGPDDGKVFYLQGDTTDIGRIDGDAPGRRTGDRAVALSGGYAAVTRVSRPHARFSCRHGVWHIEDCGSTGGTYVNGTALDRHSKTRLHNGDFIELAKGVLGASLLFALPERPASKEDAES